VPNANGIGLCPNLSGSVPGCDVLLTPGLATYSTLEKLRANGFRNHFDPKRIAVWLYDPTAYDATTGAYGTFYTYDDPTTALLKMGYVDLRHLGGGFVWALKDDDSNGTMVKTMAIGLRIP
jgi:chitinase